MTYHHHVTGALAEARLAGMGRRTLLAALLIAVGALSASTGVVAHPARDAGTSASGYAVAARDRQPRAAAGSITYANPLRRSRGPGAGAGLL